MAKFVTAEESDGAMTVHTFHKHMQISFKGETKS